MPLKPRKSKLPVRVEPYDAILSEVVGLLEAARRTAVRAVNSVMTATYWQIGRRIVESEQRGTTRADYGDVLVKRLSEDLTNRFGRGFGKSNLYQMRGFYLAYSDIFQTASGKSSDGATGAILQTPAGKLATKKNRQITSDKSPLMFPLPWSHYVCLLSVDNPHAREFYETEALRGGWTVKQLARQINSAFYERTAMSKNKAAMLTKHNRRKAEDTVTIEEELKDPFVLEFLGLKDEYSETEMEEALIRHLETFLLELGGDFTFVGRQRRLRVGDAWYRIDLLFYHRRLKCLVIIDIKTGDFTHADAGQMHLYCNYAKEHWTLPDENPPVGLILCDRKDDAVAHYSLEGLPSKVLAARYKLALPAEKLLANEIEKVRKRLTASSSSHPRNPASYPSRSPAAKAVSG
jgi:predicted nuclease of restriction endonuclease-like (RecB) superfamily